jgi:hypothetical protein
MTPSAHARRVLSPLERFTELIFGLIMVLTFTGGLSVAEVGREDVHQMFLAAVGCNFAWGVIDAAFYLISSVVETARNSSLLRAVQQTKTPDEAAAIISEVLPPKIMKALSPSDFQRIGVHLKQEPPPPDYARVSVRDLFGSLGVFLIVFTSTFPVVLPFFFIHNCRFALRVSNAIAIAILYFAGYMLAHYAGLRPHRTGLAMVVIGVLLVALTIAFGG